MFPMPSRVARPDGAIATGLVCGLNAGTEVLTLDGAIPVDYLSPGDRIVTRAGARPLRDLGLTHRVGLRAYVVQPGSLGHDRPSDEVLLGPDQLVHLRDWRAQALYGAPQALVPISRLADGDFVQEVTVVEARLFTLHFDRLEVIYAAGLELGCLPLPEAA